jgi:predicted DNA-binding protein
MSRDFSSYIGTDLSPELYHRIKAAARSQDRTCASWMREAFRERMERQEGFDPGEVEVDEAEKATA